MIPGMHLPMRMGIDSRKAVTVRVDPELYARAYDEARRRQYGDGDPKLGPFVAWVLRQWLTLDFLRAENIDFITGYLAEVGPTLTVRDLLDYCVSRFRKDVREGKVQHFFLKRQVRKSAKGDAR